MRTVIDAAIFDMDGLLIDSEPLWQQAEIEVFGSLGIVLTPRDCLETRGRRIDEVVAYWYARQSWSGPSVREVRQRIVRRLVGLVDSRGEAKRGVDHAMRFFEQRGVPLGLASSSDYVIIHAVLKKLEIADRFGAVHSGEEESAGKPHPAIYLHAAGKLGVAPARCVAIEDAPSGVAAARAAGMRCIAVLDSAVVGVEDVEREHELLRPAEFVLESLEQLDESHWRRLVTPKRPSEA